MSSRDKEDQEAAEDSLDSRWIQELFDDLRESGVADEDLGGRPRGPSADLPEEMNIEDFRVLATALRQWDVSEMPESTLRLAIEALRADVPVAASLHGMNDRKRSRERHSRLGLADVRRIPPSYWALSLAAYLVASLLSKMGVLNPYFALLLVGPLAALFGIREVFRGREQGMAELEMACVRSAVELAFSKMWVTSVFSFLMNVGFCAVLSVVFGLEVWRAIALWMAPWAFLSGTGLWLATRLRSGPVVMVLVLCWLGGGGTMAMSAEAGAWLLSQSALGYLPFVGVGFLALVGFGRAVWTRKEMTWIATAH